MAKLSIEDRIAQLEARKKSLQAKLGKQERARDTRRKILLGALVLDRLSPDQAGRNGESPEVHIQGSLADWIKRELPGFLTRDDDKALFQNSSRRIQKLCHGPPWPWRRIKPMHC